MSQSRERTVFVPAGHGGAIPVAAGEFLSVVDLEGAQVADFVAIQRADPRKTVSPHQTRSSLRRLTLRVGDRLVNQDREPVLEIVRDDVGVHDLLFCACSPALYRQRFGLTDHRSCRMNLLEALAPYHVEEWQLPDPVNLFMKTPPRPDGEFDFHPAPRAQGPDRLPVPRRRRRGRLLLSHGSGPHHGERVTSLELVVGPDARLIRGPMAVPSTARRTVGGHEPVAGRESRTSPRPADACGSGVLSVGSRWQIGCLAPEIQEAMA